MLKRTQTHSITEYNALKLSNVPIFIFLKQVVSECIESEHLLCSLRRSLSPSLIGPWAWIIWGICTALHLIPFNMEEQKEKQCTLGRDTHTQNCVIWILRKHGWLRSHYRPALHRRSLISIIKYTIWRGFNSERVGPDEIRHQKVKNISEKLIFGFVQTSQMISQKMFS